MNNKGQKLVYCRSIKSYLGNKICILVTHQIQFLQDATRIIVLENVCFEMKNFNG
jgi:ABC-type bacteriocin/lantibiotic exporter with double-glycine peptidase domain